jgi:hydrogenase/urease accessory protein HupE
VAGFVVATIALHVAGAGLGTWIRRQAWLRTAVGAFLAAAGAALVALAA